MAITRRNLATAAAGGAVGVVSAELLLHARRRQLASRRATRLAAGAVGGGAITLAGLEATGVVGLPMGSPAGLAGFGATTLGWTAARELGVAPRLTVDVPDEINLAGSLATTLALSTVGLAAATLAGAVG